MLIFFFFKQDSVYSLYPVLEISDFIVLVVAWWNMTGKTIFSFLLYKQVNILQLD